MPQREPRPDEIRYLTVLAQDPSVTDNGKALTTQVAVPLERIEPGPKGHRVHVIDYDGSSDMFYPSRRPFLKEDKSLSRGGGNDPYSRITDIDRLVRDPHFHQQNVYAIVMTTLREFEMALGRHVPWGFKSDAHHIKVAPHAFADANAFYSRRDEGLFFGYFRPRAREKHVFTCLSYDIVAHETTHAILDSLRTQYSRPSHDDQAAFHEGFADIVALLSVMKNEELIGHALERVFIGLVRDDGRVSIDALHRAITRKSFLVGLGEQFGQATKATQRDALRRSAMLTPSKTYLDPINGPDEFREPHRRGEVLVAAVLHAFLGVWMERLRGKVKTAALYPGLAALARRTGGITHAEPWRVVEEGAKAAGHLLRMMVRAIDYLPPVDMDFSDFLSAALTADREYCPDDSTYGYRPSLRRAFGGFGIEPVATEADGLWDEPKRGFRYGHAHSDPMRWDPTALARFIWENRTVLKLNPDALTKVQSVRPVVRTGSDGFQLRETVAEYLQILQIKARELGRLGITRPKALDPDEDLKLYGGGTLIFDEYGRLKFNIGSGVASKKQHLRLQSLIDHRALKADAQQSRRFAQIHLRRAVGDFRLGRERW